MGKVMIFIVAVAVLTALTTELKAQQEQKIKEIEQLLEGDWYNIDFSSEESTVDTSWVNQINDNIWYGYHRDTLVYKKKIEVYYGFCNKYDRTGKKSFFIKFTRIGLVDGKEIGEGVCWLFSVDGYYLKIYNSLMNETLYLRKN